MSKQEWTKEPWKIFTATSKPDVMVGIGEESSGDAITPALWGTDEEAMANARRIVDCVNACTGIDNPAEYISSLRQENERLRSALGRLVEVAKAYGIFMAGVTPLNVLRSEDMQSEHKSFADGIQSARQALTKEG